jgi:hypothetical protein
MKKQKLLEKASNKKTVIIGMVSLLYALQTLLLFLSYKLTAYIINQGAIEYDRDIRLPLPTTGQWIMLLGFFIVLVIGFVISIIIRNAYKKSYNIAFGNYQLKEIIFLNSISISVLLIFVYLFFDPLISTSCFILLFLSLIYFKD